MAADVTLADFGGTPRPEPRPAQFRQRDPDDNDSEEDTALLIAPILRRSDRAAEPRRTG